MPRSQRTAYRQEHRLPSPRPLLTPRTSSRTPQPQKCLCQAKDQKPLVPRRERVKDSQVSQSEKRKHALSSAQLAGKRYPHRPISAQPVAIPWTSQHSSQMRKTSRKSLSQQQRPTRKIRTERRYPPSKLPQMRRGRPLSNRGLLRAWLERRPPIRKGPIRLQHRRSLPLSRDLHTRSLSNREPLLMKHQWRSKRAIPSKKAPQRPKETRTKRERRKGRWPPSASGGSPSRP